MTALTTVQHEILNCLKSQGEMTNTEIAERLGVSYEAVRQQLRQLERAQLVSSRKRHEADPRSGRPNRLYALSPTGDHLFPKAYDDLAVSLIDTLAESLGPGAVRQVLTSLTDENVSRWAPQLREKALPERLEALKGIYLENDPYMEVSRDEAAGVLRLVERNCPFLNVASRRPLLCSVTVSTLSRLLGHTVTREKRFQNGDGRCVFLVHLDQPVDAADFRFAFEDEMDGSH